MKTPPPLFGETLRALAIPWVQQLGATDAASLQAIFSFSIAPTILLSDCLTKLYPGLETKPALDNLNRLRDRINKAAREHLRRTPGDVTFQFHADTNKKSPPTQRHVWFTGPRQSLDDATNLGLARLPVSPVEPRFLPDDVQIFVSFSMKDKTEMDELVDLLIRTWGPQRSHRVRYWRFDRPGEDGILAGEDNEKRIRDAMASSPLGLLLLSPDYTASKFIKEVELPAYFPPPPDKHPIFVNLRNATPSAKYLPAEIKPHFIFSHQGKDYSEMTTRSEKEKFAMALNDHIEGLCKKHFLESPPAPPHPPQSHPAQPLPTFHDNNGYLECTPIEPQFHRRDSFPDYTKHPEETNLTGINAVEDLVAWAQDEERACYFALLGEVGSGKTTATLMFAKRLNELGVLQRAYYFDLRFVNHDRLLKRTNNAPKLQEILTAILGRQSQTQPQPDAQLYLEAVRHQQAVLIFDGLDEVLPSLDTTEQAAFMHQLMQSLTVADTRHPQAGKILLSCRTHYFRTSITERGAFTVQGRERIEEQASACTNRACFENARLLPFTKTQIEAYFQANLPDLPFGKIWKMLAAIHNLRELATRPYLLNLIRQQIPRLNATLERGEVLQAIDLYHGFLEDWVEARNKDHTIIDHEDKLTLMGHLAAWMWSRNAKSVSIRDLEEWLKRTIFSVPLLDKQYSHHFQGTGRDPFLAELRTATFVARWQGDDFRFAHTSLQEYFLASHLLRSLEEGNAEAWDLPMVSLETLDFLGQMLAITPEQAQCLRTMEQWMGGDDLKVACLAFQYWLEAIRLGHPEPSPKFVKIPGADVEDWVVRGHSAERPLNLRGADLRGIQLNRSRVEWIDATGADLTGAQFREALLIEVNAAGGRLVNADLSNLQWRGGSLLGADVTGAKLAWQSLSSVRTGKPRTPLPYASRGIERLYEDVNPVYSCAWSPDGKKLLSGSADATLKVWDAASGRCLFDLTGHQNSVRACAWSPDGKKFLSGSDDGSLKVWDAASGRCLLDIAGHKDRVLACGWSPDGKKIISGSDDGSLKVRDTQSGCSVLALTGAPASVIAWGWSPDGQSLLTGSKDKTLKIWNIATGRCLRSLVGHEGAISACAWSPDGQKLLSGSADKTLKIWDAWTGGCQRTFAGHEFGVQACAWSPDGEKLLSGAADNLMAVWEAATGRLLLTLPGHKDSISACSWSPDSQELLSGSIDETLKIWDSLDGTCLRTLHLLPERQTAAISGDQQQVMHVSSEAWRWLRWQTLDAQGNPLQLLPIEAFGAIPGLAPISPQFLPSTPP